MAKNTRFLLRWKSESLSKSSNKNSTDLSVVYGQFTRKNHYENGRTIFYFLNKILFTFLHVLKNVINKWWKCWHAHWPLANSQVNSKNRKTLLSTKQPGKSTDKNLWPPTKNRNLVTDQSNRAPNTKKFKTPNGLGFRGLT